VTTSGEAPGGDPLGTTGRRRPPGAPTARSVTPVRFGPDGGLPAGLARIPARTGWWRGHAPTRSPAWFGPAVGAPAVNRFDLHQRSASQPGTCYLALGLEGVLLERVLRGVYTDLLSERDLARAHAVTRVRADRDLVLIDLVQALSTVHRLELAAITAAPDLAVGPHESVYPATTAVAARFVAEVWAGAYPEPVDGILYGSRFGPAALCVALWDTAADALRWGRTRRLTIHVPGLDAACQRLGIGLLP